MSAHPTLLELAATWPHDHWDEGKYHPETCRRCAVEKWANDKADEWIEASEVKILCAVTHYEIGVGDQLKACAAALVGDPATQGDSRRASQEEGES